MSIALIIEFVAVLAAMIFLHEFGHFIACKILGVEVEEFGFGIPPRALTMFTLGGTKFTLNWLPLGGFVRPKGENDPDVPGGLGAAKPWKRIAMFLAGPTMNLLTALAIFIFVYALVGYLPDRNKVQLVGISPDSPAATVGLQTGDILVSVEGVAIHSLDSVKPIIYNNLGKPITFTIERNGTTYQYVITPLANPGSSGAVGILMSYPTKPYNFMAAIPEGFYSMSDYMKQLFSVVAQVVRGQSASPDARLVGIKGMFDLFASVSQSTTTTGVPRSANVLVFIASISISLGIMNLLPIPALDGGRILFVLPELFFHRRIPPKYEVWVNFISFALLILLMLFINLQDFIHPITTPLP
jgi:regulator of sigma E protease